jgi:hypothetical protein
MLLVPLLILSYRWGHSYTARNEWPQSRLSQALSPLQEFSGWQIEKDYSYGCSFSTSRPTGSR